MNMHLELQLDIFEWVYYNFHMNPKFRVYTITMCASDEKIKEEKAMRLDIYILIPIGRFSWWWRCGP